MSTAATANNSVLVSTQSGPRNAAHEAVPSMQLEVATFNNGARSSSQGSGTRKHWQVRQVARSVSSSSQPSVCSDPPLTVNYDSNGWIQASNDGSHRFSNYAHFNPNTGGAPDMSFYPIAQWPVQPQAPDFNQNHNGPPVLHPPAHLAFPSPHIHNIANQSYVDAMSSAHPYAGSMVMEDDRSGRQTFYPNMFPQAMPQSPNGMSGMNGYPIEYAGYYAIPHPDTFPDFSSFGLETNLPPYGHPTTYVTMNGMHPFGMPHGPMPPIGNPMGDMHPPSFGGGPDFNTVSPSMLYGPPIAQMMGSAPPVGPQAPPHRPWDRSNQGAHKSQGKFLYNRGSRKGNRLDNVTAPLYPAPLRTGRTNQHGHRDSENGQHGSNKRPAPPRDTAPVSPLLTRFRLSKDHRWNFEDILGHLVEFSKDQHGSRFIQQALEDRNMKRNDALFAEIAPDHLNVLLRHVSGNYVIQKLLDYGTQDQINTITALVEEQAYELALDTYGCRVVQKTIEIVSKEQQMNIVSKLHPHAFECVLHSNGNHVIQKLIALVDSSILTFLSCIADNICTIAKHTYGCRVLQRCLEHLSAKYSKDILDAIHANVVELMEDQYGNYVVQFILENGRVHDQKRIMESIQGNFINLARHKFASNVCEKALISADSDLRSRMINEILKGDPTDFKQPSPLSAMIKDQYGNYVLQQALRVAEGEQRRRLTLLIPPMLAFLQETTTNYSRSINSIDRLLSEEMARCSI